jgi:hypothetical protein
MLGKKNQIIQGSSNDSYYWGKLGFSHTDGSTGDVFSLPMDVVSSMTWGSHGGYYEDGCLPGCSAVKAGMSLPTFRRSVLPPSSGRSLLSSQRACTFRIIILHQRCLNMTHDILPVVNSTLLIADTMWYQVVHMTTDRWQSKYFARSVTDGSMGNGDTTVSLRDATDRWQQIESRGTGRSKTRGWSLVGKASAATGAEGLVPGGQSCWCEARLVKPRCGLAPWGLKLGVVYGYGSGILDAQNLERGAKPGDE